LKNIQPPHLYFSRQLAEVAQLTDRGLVMLDMDDWWQLRGGGWELLNDVPDDLVEAEWKSL
jgi:hypothetical protein